MPATYVEGAVEQVDVVLLHRDRNISAAAGGRDPSVGDKYGQRGKTRASSCSAGSAVRIRAGASELASGNVAGAARTGSVRVHRTGLV